MAIDPRAVARRAAARALADRARAEAGSRPRGGVHVDLRPGAGEPASDRPGGILTGTGADRGPVTGRGPDRGLVTVDDLLTLRDNSSLDVPRGALVTALARDEAARRGIRLVEAGASAPPTPGSGATSAAPDSPADTPGRALRVAVGADHGGFPLKGELLGWVRSLGHVPVDLGTTSTAAVDYPDFAGAVAEAVAAGTCDLGVCIDGAGIGSAIAANKVPGVRAATCWDRASASNAREHNYANVLCLGGPRLERSEALAILETFLGTPHGAERHGRRVAKITRLEQRYTRDTAPRP